MKITRAKITILKNAKYIIEHLGELTYYDFLLQEYDALPDTTADMIQTIVDGLEIIIQIDGLKPENPQQSRTGFNSANSQLSEIAPPKTKMNLSQKRCCALGVLNYNNRHSSDGQLIWDDAKLFLDDWSREHQDTVAARFWLYASEHQITLLRRDYNRR